MFCCPQLSASLTSEGRNLLAWENCPFMLKRVVVIQLQRTHDFSVDKNHPNISQQKGKGKEKRERQEEEVGRQKGNGKSQA